MTRSPGRPLSARAAWQLISSVQDGGPKQLPGTFDDFRRKTYSRARHLDLYVHPSLLAGLLNSGKTVIGGRFAATMAGAPVDESGTSDLYVRTGQVEPLMDHVGAQSVLENANLLLHVVDDSAWPFPVGAQHVNPWVAWLDLADRQDRAADTLLDRLVGGRVHA